MIREQPDNPRALRLRALSLAGLGRLEEGKQAFQESLRIQPDYSVAAVMDNIGLFLHPDLTEKIVAALRELGVEL